VVQNLKVLNHYVLRPIAESYLPTVLISSHLPTGEPKLV
jgi:hypothetical protein